MKKIGFIDLYLSEWHANEYPAWICRANEVLNEDFVLSYAWGEEEISPVDSVTNTLWCEKNGVELCDSIEEVCEKSDCIFILAPSNPEKHLEYAERALKYKKPTYIDKTFAPDFLTAKKIFDLGKKYACPFFSTSALRYAQELEELSGGRDFVITGNGGNFAEYLIHTAEMAAILLNSPAKRIKTECMGNRRICRIQTESENEALLIQGIGLDYTLAGKRADGKNRSYRITSDFFFLLICDVLRFFVSGKAPFDPAQTLEVMRLRDALLEGEKMPETWIEL